MHVYLKCFEDLLAGFPVNKTMTMYDTLMSISFKLCYCIFTMFVHIVSISFCYDIISLPVMGYILPTYVMIFNIVFLFHNYTLMILTFCNCVTAAAFHPLHLSTFHLKLDFSRALAVSLAQYPS